MTDSDLITQAEEACDASIPKGPMTEESFMIIDNRSRLLPRLLAEAKQQAELIKRLRHDLNNSTCNEEVAIILHVKTRAMEERDAWKAKAIEERAKSLYPFDSVFHCWSDVPEEDTVDGNCPIITIWGKKHWREVAAKELAEEMRQNG